MGAPLQADARKSRATALNDLGLLLEAQGELGEAEEAYRRSAEAHAEEFEIGHPATAAVRANLASALAMRGDAQQAAALMRQSLAVIKQHSGAVTTRLRGFTTGSGRFLKYWAAWRTPRRSILLP